MKEFENNKFKIELTLCRTEIKGGVRDVGWVHVIGIKFKSSTGCKKT